MNLRDGGTTNPALLHRLVDWSDAAAWREFVDRYHPLVEDWCRRLRLDAETADELCQRVWIDLARRIATFRYDPSKTFRGWLRRLLYSRAVDLLRARRADPVRFLEEEPQAALDSVLGTTDIEVDEENESPARPALLQLAREVHDSVKSRVEPSTWQAFWAIAVDGWTVRETAQALNLSYAAAFAAHKRVVLRLREEGRRAMSKSRDLGPTGGQQAGFSLEF